MARERSRDRGRRSEQLSMDPKERALDEITNLYVKDKISLDQYETLAAQVQQSSDPESVLRSALVSSRPEERPEERAEERQAFERQRDAFRPTERTQGERHPSERREPRMPSSPIFSENSFPAFRQNGRSGDFFLCIMGERRVDGRMLTSRSSSSVTLMGSTTIDLRDIEVPESGLRIDLVAVMGEVRVLVAPGTPVHFSVVPIMGEAVSRADYPTAGTRAGVLEIAGMALMGSVTVRVVS